MTAQIGEILYYKNREHRMCSEPLGDYFALGGERPAFESNCTALWRGYIGTWEILDGRLYLIGLSGTLEDGTKVTLASLFPGFPNRVFAHWFSGTLRIPEGKLLDYVHMGYGSKYERDILIRLEKGVVTATEVRTNGRSEDQDAPEGYGIGAMTVFSTRDKGKEPL
jgi:hypothetical protein